MRPHSGGVISHDGYVFGYGARLHPLHDHINVKFLHHLIIGKMRVLKLDLH